MLVGHSPLNQTHTDHFKLSLRKDLRGELQSGS